MSFSVCKSAMAVEGMPQPMDGRSLHSSCWVHRRSLYHYLLFEVICRTGDDVAWIDNEGSRDLNASFL